MLLEMLNFTARAFGYENVWGMTFKHFLLMCLGFLTLFCLMILFVSTLIQVMFWHTVKCIVCFPCYVQRSYHGVKNYRTKRKRYKRIYLEEV
jgi:hypothetical protein